LPSRSTDTPRRPGPPLRVHPGRLGFHSADPQAGPATMPDALPTASEMHAFAEATGQIDDQGRYKVSRQVLAAGAQRWKQNMAEDAERARTSTARKLAEFAADLVAED